MGKNFAGRLNRLLSATTGSEVAAAEARLAPWREHFGARARAKILGLPEPEHVPYDGEEDDRELVARHYPPDYGVRERFTRKLDMISERLKTPSSTGGQND